MMSTRFEHVEFRFREYVILPSIPGAFGRVSQKAVGNTPGKKSKCWRLATWHQQASGPALLVWHSQVARTEIVTYIGN